MTIDLITLLVVALGYLGLLFLVAWLTERGLLPARLARHPVTFSLSLGVYATTWTYYGSVGFADHSGFLFLTIYLGVTLTFILAPLLLSPILRLVRDRELQSLADLLAFRYASRFTGPLVTVFMLLGLLPYMALQIRAVTDSMEVLTGHHADPTSPLLAALFCALITLFAVAFGARQLKSRARHEGLVMAIAFESSVKLAALLAAGVFVVVVVFGGWSGVGRWLSRHPHVLSSMYAPVGGDTWITLLLLSASAAFLLPRCFHMLFVENGASDGLATASWLYPLYLLLLNLPIPLILWAGIKTASAAPPDYFVLALARRYGGNALTLLAYVGGVSAASAMLIVESLALAGMCLNHLTLPLWLPRRRGGDLYRQLRRWRRLLLASVIGIGYLAYVVMRQNQGLAQMGMISFLAVTQFLPGVVALLSWPRATGAGFVAGACGGMAVWFVRLMLPLFGVQLWSVPHPPAPDWPSLTFWTLATNIVLLVLVSLATRPRTRELLADQAIRLHSPLLREDPHVPSVAQLTGRLSAALGPADAEREMKRALGDCQLDPQESRPHALLALEHCLERNLSGLVGPHLAWALLGTREPAGRLVEEYLERSSRRLTGLAAELDHLRRLHRQMLRELPICACSISGEGRVRLWNRRLSRLTGLAEDAALGYRVGDLPAPWADLLLGFLSVTDTQLYRVQLSVPGRVLWLNLHKATVGPGPESDKIVLIEDLTEQRLLEAELAHSERLASIGTLAAGIAHEIGNPLTGIGALAQNLKLDVDTELRQGLDEILEQVRRIQRIVSTLLSFSHPGVESGCRTERFALAACVDEALRLVQLGCAHDRARFLNHVPRSLQLFGERQQIVQVLVNLLTNAADASSRGGEIAVYARDCGDGVRFEVEDHGCGIPSDTQERVFEPFFTTKAPGRGTGLGLSVVYGIVREHGGRVSIESKPGSGTRVAVFLPQFTAGELA